MAILLDTTETEYYSTKIMQCQHDQKQLFHITDKLLSDQQTKYPNSDNDVELANKFSRYFETKIDNIRADFKSDETTGATLNPLTQTKFSKLRATDNVEVRNVIKLCANKTCELDPIPTWLLKSCIDELLPILTRIFNVSLTTGQIPDALKVAIIKPHLKKPNLDSDELKNFRPVSNLHFISKVLEKLVAQRLEEHMSLHNLHDHFQSAYRTSHSTETALMKLNNDILSTLDTGRCMLLASLDLSAAFDTVDHAILVRRLKHLFCIDDTALLWFQSYLHNRSTRVNINNSLSETFNVTCGVPQGSVLGARMYTMYTQPLTNIISKHDILYHCYADDTQVYLQCDNNTQSIDAAKVRLQLCIANICEWMDDNALKINTDKTEFIIFSHSPTTVDNTVLQVGSNCVKSSNHVKILGVTLDSRMTLERHISLTSRAVYFQIRRINSIRRYLTTDAVRTLTQATVTPRLDYCNSLYVGLPMKNIKRLQLSQNSAARVISRAPRYSHISDTLRTLHWLPIKRRCQFKTMVMTHKALHAAVPNYVSEMLKWYHPSRLLRSASTTSLVPKRHRTIRLGTRLFDTSAATLWNSLPNDVKEITDITLFKKQLKTYLFAM